MTLKHSLVWLTRGFAVVGILSLVLVGTQILTNLFSRTTNSEEGYGYDGDYREKRFAALGTSPEISEDELATASSPSLGEFLYDEAVAAEVEQKIIKTGNLDVTIDDAQQSADVFEALAIAKGGFVQTSSVREHTDGTHSGYLIIRVPATEFESLMNDIKKQSLVVEEETVSSQDVTEQYIDLSARLKNAQAQEARYVEILEVAKTVEEILQIEEALANVRGYIESLTGQVQYLERQADLSTLTVNLSEEPIVVIGGKEFRPGTTVKQAFQAVVAIAQWIVVAVIWVVIVGVGIGVPLALIVWLIWNGVTRLRKK